MKKTHKIGLVLGLAVAMMAMGPVQALAQQDPGTQIIPSLELQQADVRDALRALFRNVNVNYSIAPEVQGTVTVSLKNVLFEQALQNILKQVDATYRIDSGVFEIVKREAPTPTNSGNTAPESSLNVTNKIIRRIYIRSADPAFIFRMIKGSTATNITPEISQSRATSVAGGGGLG